MLVSNELDAEAGQQERLHESEQHCTGITAGHTSFLSPLHILNEGSLGAPESISRAPSQACCRDRLSFSDNAHSASPHQHALQPRTPQDVFSSLPSQIDQLKTSPSLGAARPAPVAAGPEPRFPVHHAVDFS
jgi:hypothetical protein